MRIPCQRDQRFKHLEPAPGTPSKFPLLAGVVFFQSLLLSAPVQAEEYKAQVVSVTDGDSLLVSRDRNSEKVILYGVDCPELKQEFGSEARKFTVDSCFGKTITIKPHGTDPRGRVIADVTLSDGTDLNQELVRKGLAWWSDKYAPSDKTLKNLHQSAKSAKLGLWATANPVPPWIFRNGQKSVTATIKPSKP